MASALSDFSPERAVFAVVNACKMPWKPKGTVHMNKRQTCYWLFEITLTLMSVTTRVDHTVITLAGYGVLDRDNLSPQKIIRKHGEWVLDGFVPNKSRPLDSVEVNELSLALGALFKKEELVRNLGVSFGAILELAKDDNADKRRFVVKILMELCLPLTAYTLYAILVLHVLERQVEAQERQIKPDVALHIYSNLLVLQQIKRDLASDPPKPFCQVILTNAIQYQPEAAARELLGLKEALNDTMGTFVHESVKDCF
ncbi:hypothetical protein F4806DRAFT_108203 [Annulohypoxylon nitens]|nr:hypothetical protein F4806DRAFT_108203 [Annulohypoxylon nitens]